jgi:hypothetical protein
MDAITSVICVKANRKSRKKAIRSHFFYKNRFLNQLRHSFKKWVLTRAKANAIGAGISPALTEE